MNNKSIFVILFFCLTFYVKKPLQAQDLGVPVMKQLTYYSMLGGFSGALLGGFVWFTDPLSPSVDFSANVTSGFAYGVLLGFALGAQQMFGALQKAEEEEEPDEEDLPPPFDFDPDPVEDEEELTAWRLNRVDPNVLQFHQNGLKRKYIFQANILQVKF